MPRNTLCSKSPKQLLSFGVKLVAIVAIVVVVLDVRDGATPDTHNQSRDQQSSDPKWKQSSPLSSSRSPRPSSHPSEAYDAHDEAAHQEALRLFNVLMPKGRGETSVDDQSPNVRIVPQEKIVGPDADVEALFQRLGNRSIVRYTWVGGGKDDDDLIDLMSRIPTPHHDPPRSLLEHVHRAAVGLAHLENSHGGIIVGLGTGKAALVRFRHRISRYEKSGMQRYGKPILPFLDMSKEREDETMMGFFPGTTNIEKLAKENLDGRIYQAAKRLRYPAMFHSGVFDLGVDGFVHRAPHYYGKNRMKNFMDEHPLLFLTHCTPVVVNDETGQLAPRVLPLPHQWHFVRGGEYPKDGMPGTLVTRHLLSKRNAVSEDAFMNRPRKVVWRGTTAGIKHNQTNPEAPFENAGWEHSDRGRLFQAFYNDKRFADINNVALSYVSNGGTYGRMMGGELAKKDWGKAGRLIVDVDGFSTSWEGLRWKLLHGGPVFKIDSSEGHIQWYYHLLEDEVHLKVATLVKNSLVTEENPSAETFDENLRDISVQMKRVMDDPALALRLMRNAIRLSVELLTPITAEHYTQDAIVNCWENLESWSKKDWRIRRKTPAEGTK